MIRPVRFDNRVHLSPPADFSGKRRSLVLAGGGIRVAYQAGVLKALEEEGLHFHHGDGTSGGTINLAMLFSGLSPAEMCDRWRSLQIRDFVSSQWCCENAGTCLRTANNSGFFADVFRKFM